MTINTGGFISNKLPIGEISAMVVVVVADEPALLPFVLELCVPPPELPFLLLVRPWPFIESPPLPPPLPAAAAIAPAPPPGGCCCCCWDAPTA